MYVADAVGLCLRYFHTRSPPNENKWLRSAVCGCCLEILWPQWALAQVDLAGLAAARA